MPEGKSRKVVAFVAACLALAGTGALAGARPATAPVAHVQVSGVARDATTTTTAPTTTTTALPAPVTTAAPATTTPPTPSPIAPPVIAAPTPTILASEVPAAPTLQQRGDAALALLGDYPWQRLGYKVSFEDGRDGLLGVANSALKTISVYVRDSHDPEEIARTLAHEMGHALDFSFLTPSEVSQYIAIRGINATPDSWFGCDGCTDYETAAGDFAEVFQYWLLGPGQFLSQMGPPPTAEQLAQLAPLFAPSK